MKDQKLTFLLFSLFILACLSLSWNYFGKKIHEIPSMPPESLKKFYPPESEQPVYLFLMLETEHNLNGIIVNLYEHDIDNMMKSYEKFKQSYIALSGLVPEWTKDFPAEPVEELEPLLRSNDMQLIMSKIGEIGKVCSDCHVENMVKVQQKFRWRDFHTVIVNDPVTNERTNFAELMRSSTLNFNGISINLAEGQIENAKKQYDLFKTRFISLKGACMQCHSTERKYYTDEIIEKSIDDIGNVLNSSAPDPKKINELIMMIGTESCDKCHLIHTPAAMTNAAWRMQNR